MQETYTNIYTAKPEFIKELCDELNNETTILGELVFSAQNRLDVCFAQDIWLNPQKVVFESISQAVNILRQAGKFWYLHPLSHIRRSRLIESQLRKLPPLTHSFPLNSPLPAIGVFSLLDQHTMIYSAERLKKWPDGKCYFIEDKVNPPNRAYLKLWEALTLLEEYPQAGDTALDLGASPGGWTFVMQSLGAHVTAVDKAPLEPRIDQLPNISFLQQSAFALDPEKITQTYDWVLSDVACYPGRAYTLIQRWLASGRAKQLIFTIKLQGKTDFEPLNLLKAIPNSWVTNLFYNKHEATFFYPAPKNVTEVKRYMDG